MAVTRNQSMIDLEQHLAFELTRVVEEGAGAAARTMGQGDRKGDATVSPPLNGSMRR